MSSVLLVLGSSGQVAQDLAEIAGRFGFSKVVRLGRESGDLLAADAGTLLDTHCPGAIINAAAHTAVDRAESEPEAAHALNAALPERFAAAAAARGVPFVQISTDYVFDGSKTSPYLEDDPRSPLGVYGASKAAGEDAVLAAGGKTAIMRTAWVYGPHGANFLKTMLRLSETRAELGVVNDQVGCPTPSADVAEGAIRIARGLIDGSVTTGSVFHCAGAGEASWADFATAIFEEQARRGRAAPTVRRISSAEYPTPAARPASSRLDCSRLEATVGWRPQAWRSALTLVFEDARIGGPA